MDCEVNKTYHNKQKEYLYIYVTYKYTNTQCIHFYSFAHKIQ